MRVIGGSFRSRRLKAVAGDTVRPTPDRLRETLFNVLAPVIEGAVFVDAYAGTGAVGIEALSRGASRCIFIEPNRAALAVLRENLTELGVGREAEVVSGKAIPSLVKYGGADIIFLDPPYPLEKEYRGSLELLGSLPARGLVIVQHEIRFELSEAWGELKRYRMLKHGDNCLSFLKRNEPGM